MDMSRAPYGVRGFNERQKNIIVASVSSGLSGEWLLALAPDLCRKWVSADEGDKFG